MADPNWSNRTIWTGDNLPIMRGMNSESVDLIYLDPPFNSKANYAAPIGSAAAGAAFKDTWTLDDVDIAWLDLIEAKHPQLNRVIHAAMTKSDKSYLIYMAVRVLEMKRLLKPTGSIYLHCDPTMSHYLKLMMDGVFGRQTFVNEIIWNRSQSRSSISRKFRRAHDVLLLYANELRNFNVQYRELSEASQALYSKLDEKRGRYRLVPILVSGMRNGATGEIWRGIDPNTRGKSGMHWVTTPDKLEKYEQEGRIFWPQKEGGVPSLKYFLNDSPGAPVNDLWTDISLVSPQAKEGVGYPTQKPLALLDRIIKASSNEGDVVLDPFCGCATTLVSADRLNRNWVGMDISEVAVTLVEKRIREDQGLFQDIKARTDNPQRNDLGDLPPYNSPKLKNALYGEQGGDCNGCGTHFQKQHLTVDHIIARKQGGTDHVENLQLLCGHCNSVKGDRGQEYLLSKLAN